MNLLNIKALSNKGADVALVGGSNGNDSPHLRITMATFDDGRTSRMTGYEGPPNPYESDRFTAETESSRDPLKRMFVESDPSCAIVAESLDAFASGQRSIRATLSNGDLSRAAKERSLAAAGTGYVAAAGAHFAKLQAISANLDQVGAKLFDAPEPDSANAGIDTEARAEFRKLSIEDQLTILSEIGTPKNARLLLALRRTPIQWRDPNIAGLIDRGWRSRVATERPQEVSQYETARANHEWATGLVSQLARSTMETYSLDGFEVYKALKPTGGTAVARLDPGAVQTFEYRLARAAA